MPALRYLLLLLLPVALSACALFADNEKKGEDQQAQQYYKEGESALKAGDYQTAIKHFEDLESRFPFGSYAQQAQLDVAYAYYKYNEPESAITAADRFIKLYPRHPAADYAYYLKGLARFPEASTMDHWFYLDNAERDPGAAQESFQYFSELVQRFPESKYAADAVQRMTNLRNHLARYELAVADYYFRRGAYLAAANRAKYVLEHYAQSASVPQALELMVQSYDKLGLTDLRNDVQRIIELNDAKRKQPPAGSDPQPAPADNKG